MEEIKAEVVKVANPREMFFGMYRHESEFIAIEGMLYHTAQEAEAAIARTNAYTKMLDRAVIKIEIPEGWILPVVNPDPEPKKE